MVVVVLYIAESRRLLAMPLIICARLKSSLPTRPLAAYALPAILGGIMSTPTGGGCLVKLLAAARRCKCHRREGGPSSSSTRALAQAICPRQRRGRRSLVREAVQPYGRRAHAPMSLAWLVVRYASSVRSHGSGRLVMAMS